ncbi:MAG TPA: SDR family oxidoreductase [Polyangiales bacterium]|jgi:dTDP-4-dehydrorhamnose reductase
MTEWLVTGAGGALGSVLMRVLSELRTSAEGFVTLDGAAPDVGKVTRVDLRDVRTYRDRVFALQPRVIVHLAAVSAIKAAYDDPERARAVNVDATAALLAMSEALGAHFVYASTDLVFDGEHAPYDEDATPEPATIYGRTKLEAECHVLTYRRGLVLRFPLMYGLPDVRRAPNFFQTMVSSLEQARPIQLFEDELRTPLWLDDAALACARLGGSDLRGVVHLGGPERLSRFEMGQRIAGVLGCDPRLVIAARRDMLQSPEPRAHDVSLVNRRYREQFASAVGRTMNEALPLAFSRGPSRLLS